jgi:succinate dehydrogenase / fumarate reductase iron-sulfur subunit
MAAANELLQLSIYRFDPAVDAKPHMENYEVDLTKVPGKMLLDVIMYVKETIDETLSFRRSCREGVCGSDGMNINGKNGLACITQMVDMPKKIVLRPLPGLPVIRDLVVDMEQFFAQYERVEPYLQNDEPLPSKERLQSPEDRAKLDGLYECILCACCTSSCPSYWWNPEKFIGPAGLLQASRFIQDSRDTKTQERLAALSDPFSLFRCRGIMNCVSVCPKGLNPTKAIGAIRDAMIASQA